jgi:hypothetical protein
LLTAVGALFIGSLFIIKRPGKKKPAIYFAGFHGLFG